jgi:hypothetical protein
MRTNPHILEVNARAWFKKIQREIPDVVALDDIPDDYIVEIKDWGFDALWLMGVWQGGAAAKEIARENAGVNEGVRKVIPEYSKGDIWASPYAILDYSVADMFGGNEALLRFKKRLNDYDIALILDFVGNHLTVDHPLTLSDSDIFVRPTTEPNDKDTFFQTENGDWLAHGKDPFTPAWTDTVQLNLFNPKARDLVVSQVLQVMELCDGVRCDVTMVMLGKIFEGTWSGYVEEARPEEELWTEVLRHARAKNPSFVFIAEVYWGLEWEVQELGFDYTYDKVLYDRLLESTTSDVRGHLRAEQLFQMRSVRFVANHDEESSIAAFGPERSKAAAAVTATVPGARLFILNQLHGEKYRLPVQYVPINGEIDYEFFDFYRKLLAIINHPCFHDGQWELQEAQPTEDGGDTFDNILTWSWIQPSVCKIVVVNYSDQSAKFMLAINHLPNTDTTAIREEFTQSEFNINTAQTRDEGLKLEMAPYEVKILSIDLH